MSMLQPHIDDVYEQIHKAATGELLIMIYKRFAINCKQLQAQLFGQARWCKYYEMYLYTTILFDSNGTKII